jgi:hypothetical protein
MVKCNLVSTRKFLDHDQHRKVRPPQIGNYLERTISQASVKLPRLRILHARMSLGEGLYLEKFHALVFKPLLDV